MSLKDYFFPNQSEVFIKNLRSVEYHYNRGGIHKILFLFAYSRYYKSSIRTGLSIPKNVCGEGLSIPHCGSIVIISMAKIGKNCRIQNNVNIGASYGGTLAPRIGDNVYIGPGAVLFGDIEIADNCWIGANAVVNKSFLEPYSVILGVPAKVVRTETKNWTQIMK